MKTACHCPGILQLLKMIAFGGLLVISVIFILNHDVNPKKDSEHTHLIELHRVFEFW